MIVLSMSAVPVGLRGELTRWLLEISPGVFVGNLSARVREYIWEIVCANRQLGSATMVFSARNEQRLRFKTCGNPWDIVDIDGLQLVRRGFNAGNNGDDWLSVGKPMRGWSKASKRRRFGKQ